MLYVLYTQRTAAHLPTLLGVRLDEALARGDAARLATIERFGRVYVVQFTREEYLPEHLDRRELLAGKHGPLWYAGHYEVREEAIA